MDSRTVKIASLLFGSGLCALVYQTAWLREFRLIFGASTLATATVLAIFMGGLGAGSILLGPRADFKTRPLAYYGRLELLISVSAALTPLLVWLAARIYAALGGTFVLGLGAGTIIRLFLSLLVLSIPTFLMGGTLPAAASAVESDQDNARRRLAFLYGTNTCGAVAGAVLATFVLFEHFGTTATLWIACAVNFVIALIALGFSRSLPARAPTLENGVRTAGHNGVMERSPPAFVLTAAAVAGFAFFLMEIVWYRMLSPLLGGSTFTFGLILAVALLGVGLGGFLYSLFWGNKPPTVEAFAYTCALESLFVAIPFAVGDGLAILALLLRPMGIIGFYGHVLAWTVVTAIVVLPAAVIAGMQFPMLIGLLGGGGKGVGRHTGYAYAANTAGAICGALSGGFVLLPMLTAPGAWRLVVILLAALAVAALGLASIRRRVTLRLVPPLAGAALAVALLMAAGPSAVWRHTPIGAGRASLPDVPTWNNLRNWTAEQRRAVYWEAEGIESSVAVVDDYAFAFLVNGKNDGDAIADAPTQVMSGLLGAILHPDPRRALVVGLGTGSTAGWLAAIPSMERVDCVEFEPAMLEVATFCSPVNENAMKNSKLRTLIGDGREMLLTTPETYDLIVSEPSNPYRAGIASLFTREYYAAAARKLRPGGMFLQWMQAYEVDSQTILTAYATLASVFPHVETWETKPNDLLFIATMQPAEYDAARLREKVLEEPFRSAMSAAWHAAGLEALLARFVADSAVARLAADVPNVPLNTDDRTVMEFSFARSVGRTAGFDVSELHMLARERNVHRPALTGGQVDWDLVEHERMSRETWALDPPLVHLSFSEEQMERAGAHTSYVEGRFEDAWEIWNLTPRQPETLMETTMLGDILAALGNEAAVPLIERLREFHPGDAACLTGLLHERQGRMDEATDAFVAAFTLCRKSPWVMPTLLHRAMDAATRIAGRDAGNERSKRIYDSLSQPFSVHLKNEWRLRTLLKVARIIDKNAMTAVTQDAVHAFEPYVPWERSFLALRFECYSTLGDVRAETARRDLDRFDDATPASFSAALPEATPIAR